MVRSWCDAGKQIRSGIKGVLAEIKGDHSQSLLEKRGRG
jgi:hypothetical protein